MFAELSWPIIERVNLIGDFAVSPHGVTVAVGFLLGAQLMLRRAEKRGIARRPIKGVPDAITALVTRAAIGGIIGARLFFVLTRPSEFDLVSALQVWNGGLSLLGGIAGGVILAIPYMLRHRLSIPLLLDSLAPGLALGIFLGRVGDLIIGEHLGAATDFVLGWRCSGQYVRGQGLVSPAPFSGPQAQGCFDTAVHQTALYDLLTAGAVLALLLVLERRTRFDGFFGMTFGIAYGGGRFLTDFARAADKDLIGPLTGTQLTGIALVVAAVAWAVATRPWEITPYAWIPGEPAPWMRPEVFRRANGASDGRRGERGAPTVGDESSDATDETRGATDETGEELPIGGPSGEDRGES